MTLDQWKQCCDKAIRSSFEVRNMRVFGDEARHQRIVASRRSKVRDWIGALRLARHPTSAPLVADAVRWKIT